MKSSKYAIIINSSSGRYIDSISSSSSSVNSRVNTLISSGIGCKDLEILPVKKSGSGIFVGGLLFGILVSWLFS